MEKQWFGRFWLVDDLWFNCKTNWFICYRHSRVIKFAINHWKRKAIYSLLDGCGCARITYYPIRGIEAISKNIQNTSNCNRFVFVRMEGWPWLAMVGQFLFGWQIIELVVLHLFVCLFFFLEGQGEACVVWYRVSMLFASSFLPALLVVSCAGCRWAAAGQGPSEGSARGRGCHRRGGSEAEVFSYGYGSKLGTPIKLDG